MIDKPNFASPAWAPPGNVTDFLGKPLRQDRDFFIQPPKEIGRVVAAWSEVRGGQTLWSLMMKLAGAGVVLAVGVGVFAWLKNREAAGAKLNLREVILLMLAFVLPILAVGIAFKKKYLAYLGEQGAAVYSTRGKREDASGEFVRFAEVADIQVINKPRGKGWSDWQMRFVDGSGNRLMTLKGNSKAFAGKMVPIPIYLIATGIHSAWEGWEASRSSSI